MDFGELTRKLPIGSQTFAKLRSKGKVYVDKTAFVYELAASDCPHILTRPRRFGKSTLLSTIEELFRHGVEPYDGHDSYFKGLTIEKLWHDDGSYLVLHLDLANLNSGRTVARFEEELKKAIASFCRTNELAEPDNSSDFGACFNSMLEHLEPNSLVLLIDEYDAPLLHHYNQEQELERCKGLMEQLFSAVKIHDYKFRCVFFTGITRFQDLGLGTAGNNFTDISQAPGFAACCGYTMDELKQYFAQNLRYAAALQDGCALETVREAQVEALLKRLSAWYGGYSFAGSQENLVFSTWSVLRFFANENATLRPYWVTEEGGRFLQLLKLFLARTELEQLIAQLSQGEFVLGGKEFVQASLINPKANPYSLLFQTGYLTLSERFRAMGKAHLVCPNRETLWGLTNLLARHFFLLDDDMCTIESHSKVLSALASLDSDKMRAAFNEAIGILPYSHSPENEFWAASIIVILLFGLNLKPRAEVMSLNGRADCVFDLPRHKLTFVFEFKYEESSDPKKLDAKLAEALQQIKDRKYALDGNSEPRVARFAIVFCGAPGARGIARLGMADLIER